MSARRHQWLEGLLVVSAGIVGSALILSSSTRVGGTFDEYFYLDAGLESWRTGSNARLLAAGTMPLPIDVVTLPVYAWEQHRGQPWQIQAEYPALLKLARAPTLLFWWLILVLGWWITRKAAGRKAGIAAVGFLSLEPNLLAHAGLATTDVAFTACLLLFAFLYARGRSRSLFHRLVLPSVACGLAFSAKASAILFVPLVVLAIEIGSTCEFASSWQIDSRWKRIVDTLRRRSFWTKALAIYFLGVALAYLYCGSDWQVHPKIVAAASELPPGRLRQISRWGAEHLRIFHNGGVAFWYQIQHNLRGHGSYILGQVSERAVWYHFPVALSMKSSPSILMTLFLSIAATRQAFGHWTHWVSLLMLIASLNCRVQIGVRLQLPLIVFCALGAAIAWGHARGVFPHDPGTQTRSSRIAQAAFRSWIIVALGWMLMSAVSHWPHFLTYINEFWGGPQHGERLLSDSNFDWGQGIPDLRELIERERLPTPLAVWYFGTDPAASAPPLRLAPLHTVEIRSISELRQVVPERYLAVGTTILYGNYIKEPRWLLDRLREQAVAKRTRTFLVYDLDALSGLD